MMLLHNKIINWWKLLDHRIVIAILLLMAIGVVLISTASPSVALRIGLPSTYFIKKELIFLPVAIIVLLTLASQSVTVIRRLGIVLFVISLILITLVIPFGTTIKGAMRWLSLAGIASIEPSEFIKPSFSIVSAWFLSGWRRGDPIPGHWISTGLFLYILVMLALEPDIGQIILLTIIFLTQLFIIGMPSVLIFISSLMGGLGIVITYFVFPHVHKRIDNFIALFTGHESYQLKLSLLSFKHGGLWGVGLGQGIIKTHLPDAHTDFIFSVAAEELGIIFALFIFCIYIYITVETALRMAKIYDIFTLCAVSGLIAQFMGQTAINIGSDLGLIPTKGMTLPFISSGTSSLIGISITLGFLLGLLQSVKR